VTKPKEWFAVKRTEYSKSYQFYPPNKNNKQTIAAIEPDGGNFEVVTLIEKTAYDALAEKLKAAEAERDFHKTNCIRCAGLETERDQLCIEINELKSQNRELMRLV